MYALFKETSHANFISHKSNYGANPVANPKNWVAFDGQHVHYSTNNLDVLTQELVWYFRKTAGDLNESIFNDRATITAIKGNSVAWNQLMPNALNGNMTPYNSNGPLTFHNDSFGIQYVQIREASVNGAERAYVLGITFNSSHKYLLTYEIIANISNVTLYTAVYNGNYWHDNYPYDSTKWKRITYITTNVSQIGIGYNKGLYNLNIGNEICQMRNINVIDLTWMYGVGNEPTSVDQFDADCMRWFGRVISYEPYCAPCLRNTKVNSLKTIGFNQWDEEWAKGGNNLTTGANDSSNTTQIRDANCIPALPNTLYHIKCPGIPCWITYCNSSKQGIGYFYGSNHPSFTWTTPNNTRYLRFKIGYNGSEYNVYQNNICINISDSNLNGTYQAYEDRTYSIPITSITGKLNGTGNSEIIFPDGMKSAGSIADEIINEGGIIKAIKRVGTVDLGTLTWSVGYNIYCTAPLTNKYVGNYGTSSKYKVTAITSYDNTFEVETLTLGSNDNLVKFKAKATTTESEIKTYLNGTILNYRLQTPQTYIIDNFNLPINIKVWKSGTEIYEYSDSTGTSPKLTIHYNAQ